MNASCPLGLAQLLEGSQCVRDRDCANPGAVQEEARGVVLLLDRCQGQGAQSTDRVNELAHSAGIAVDAYNGCGGHILHHTNGMTLWRFGWANVTPLCIVQLAWGNEFASLLNGRGNAAEMRDAADVIQAIENLGYTDLGGATDLRTAEISRSQGCLQAHLQNHGLDDLVDIADIEDVLVIAAGLPATTVNLLGERGANILDHFRCEIGAEEIGQEESREVDALVGIAVPVVIWHPVGRNPQDLPRHMGQVARLCVQE